MVFAKVGVLVGDGAGVHQAPSSSSGTGGWRVRRFLTNCSECSRSSRMDWDMESSQSRPTRSLPQQEGSGRRGGMDGRKESSIRGWGWGVVDGFQVYQAPSSSSKTLNAVVALGWTRIWSLLGSRPTKV